MIDEYAAIINDPAGGLSMVDADRAMWDYHWVVGTGAYPRYLDQTASFKAGQGRFYQEAVDRGYQRSFEGMVQVMKDYVVERTSYLNSKTADSAIPNTPTITATGPAGFPINALTFHAAAFSDPQGAGTFARDEVADRGGHARLAGPRAARTVPASRPAARRRHVEVLQGHAGALRRPRGRGVSSASTIPPGSRAAPPIGYGETFIATNLTDMRGSYTTVYLRKTFDVAGSRRASTS